MAARPPDCSAPITGEPGEGASASGSFYLERRQETADLRVPVGGPRKESDGEVGSRRGLGAPSRKGQ